MPPTPESTTGRPLQGIQAAATAILGLAAFVYVTGAAVLWARLWASDLPADPVVAGLPRELLVATGLRSVVVPSLILALVALAAIALIGFYRWTGGGEAWRKVAQAIFITFILALIGSFLGSLIVATPGTWAFGWSVATFFAFFAGVVIANFLERPGATVVAIVLAVGAIGAVTRVVVELRVPQLESAVVCVNDGGNPYTGLLIGETSSGVYVGQTRLKRVLVVARDRVGELWIGTATAACSVPAAPAPPG